MSLVLNCLHALCKLELTEELVKAVFELRTACIAGYTPDLYGCHRCGSQTPDRFDLSEGRLECASCRDPNSGGIRMPLLPGTLEGLRYVCLCDPKRIFSFRLGEPECRQLSQLAQAYLSAKLERGFSTLDFYKSLLI